MNDAKKFSPLLHIFYLSRRVERRQTQFSVTKLTRTGKYLIYLPPSGPATNRNLAPKIPQANEIRGRHFKPTSVEPALWRSRHCHISKFSTPLCSE